jgi:hypothetical protein
MTDALRDAELLARAVAEGSEQALADYQATRDDLGRRFHDTTDGIASFDWNLDEVQRMHRALSEEMAREVTFLGQLGAPAGAGAGEAPVGSPPAQLLAEPRPRTQPVALSGAQ